MQNRATGIVYETPQVAYMMIALTLFSDYPKEERMRWVKDFYNATSNFDISLPHIMAGLRTPQRQFLPCPVETDDLDLTHSNLTAIVKHVPSKSRYWYWCRQYSSTVFLFARVMLHIQALSPFKTIPECSKVCSLLGGVRGGAATLYYPVWHLEVEDLLVSKNNKGTEDNRVRLVDYGVSNKLMYERLLTGGDITLFSPMMCLDYMMHFLQTQISLKNFMNKQKQILIYVRRL